MKDCSEFSSTVLVKTNSEMEQTSMLTKPNANQSIVHNFTFSGNLTPCYLIRLLFSQNNYMLM